MSRFFLLRRGGAGRIKTVSNTKFLTLPSARCTQSQNAQKLLTRHVWQPFKEQAVKRADEVGSIARVAEELGLVEQTLRNWVKAAKAGKLNPAGARQITAEQMELSRLRAQVARLEMELEITKKAAAYFAKELP